MKMEKDLEQYLNNSSIPNLKLLAGGKGPPGYNWLSEMTKGTVFLCRFAKEPDNPLLLQYHIEHKWDRAIALMSNFTGKEEHSIVDPIRFCKHMEWYETLLEGKDD